MESREQTLEQTLSNLKQTVAGQQDTPPQSTSPPERAPAPNKVNLPNNVLTRIAKTLGKSPAKVTPKNLQQVTELDLNNARISDVTPLSQLTALQELYLYGTQVSDVRPLSQLTALQKLYLNGTQVSDEAVEAFRQTRKESGLSEVLIYRREG
jgi:Leucine-rich repeat (LRR) protein